jgi:hypothetical protein
MSIGAGPGNAGMTTIAATIVNEFESASGDAFSRCVAE